MPVKGNLSEDHKAKIAHGRRQGAVVRKYLAALHNTPVRAVDVDTKIKDIEVELLHMEDDPEADVMRRLQLVRERRALESRELPPVDLKAVEKEFIEIAGDYSERTSTTYADWLDMGVPASVLKKAGIAKA